VLEAGGGLGGLWFGDQPVVAPAATPVSAGRGQLLVPWPNRIRDGRYRFAGQERQLPISEPEFHNATHGLVRWSVWRLLDSAPDRLRVGCRVVPQTGYPWELAVQAEYVVSEAGLTVTLAAENLADEPVPFAAGMHPYLDVGVAVDEAVLTVPADTHLSADDRHLPTTTEPVGDGLDFRAGRRIGSARLDDAWTGLTRDRDGWAVVEVAGARTVALHLGPQWRWVQVFTGDTLTEGARRTLAIEPMSAPADAFNSGTDVCTLAPHERWTGSFRISVVAPPSARR
jgi:aldose 1-epimerase